jgi:hypothetical protein
MVAVVGIGCPRHTTTIAPRCDPLSTNDEVFAALYSIFYHAADAAAVLALNDLPPALPLDKAANLLRCDGDTEVRKLRIRRAAIKLAASVVILKCQGAPAAVTAPYRQALDILEIPEALVQELGHAVTCSTPELSQVENTAVTVIDTNASLAALQRTCCPCIDSCKVGPLDDPSSDVSVAEFKIIVNRAASCVLAVIDPQCWDDLVPLNFEKTFVVDNTACSGDTPMCRSTKICEKPLLTAPPEISTSPKPAQPWCALLSESLKLNNLGISSPLANVLQVRTKTPAKDSYAMDYGLCESREWSVCDPDCKEGTCAVQLDCGDAHVVEQTPVPPAAAISGSKFLKFSHGLPYDYNGWTKIALEVMVNETANASCRQTSACGADSCTTTTMVSKTEPPACTCPGPQDSCKQETKMTPKESPPLCPSED